MSLKGVLKQLAAEKAKIEKEIAALGKRREAIELVFATLGAPAVKATPAAKGGKKRTAPARKKPVVVKKRMTVRDAILATVREAPAPIPVAEIIKGAVAKSGKAVASIRTQVNALANDGYLTKLPRDGRGFFYGPGSAEPAKKKPGRKKKVAAEAAEAVAVEAPRTE